MSLDTLARACISLARSALRGAYDPFYSAETAAVAAENALLSGDVLRAIENARHSVHLSQGDTSTAWRLCAEAYLNAKATTEAHEQLAALRTLPEREARYAERINAARAARGKDQP